MIGEAEEKKCGLGGAVEHGGDGWLKSMGRWGGE